MFTTLLFKLGGSDPAFTGGGVHHLYMQGVVGKSSPGRRARKAPNPTPIYAIGNNRDRKLHIGIRLSVS